MSKLTEYIIKNSKKRDSRLKYDFMPSLLEIIERPAHIGGTIIILGVFTMLICAIVWANISRVDIVVTASGKVIPSGNEIVVQAQTSGIIKSVRFEEGQYIEKGQAIMEMDTSQLGIDEKSNKEKIDIVSRQKSLYQDILSGKDVSVYKISSYSDAFRPYAIGIIEQEKSYKSSIEALNYDIKSLSIDLNVKKISNENYKGKLTSSVKALQELDIQKITTQINKIKTQIHTLDSNHKTDISGKLSELENQYIELSTQLTKITDAKKNQVIVAPISGYISQLQTIQTGSVINQSEKVATMISEKTPNTIECYLNNKDISSINKGDSCKIKLEAYPYSDYGTVKGKVVYISKDSISNDKIKNMYIIRVEIFNNNNIDICSGLSGNIEIKVGKRSVMSYFLEPITKGLNESLKEK